VAISCEEFKNRLQDYVTRQLEPEERRQVDAHLLECADCQHELAVMTAIVSTLDHQPVTEPSSEFTSKVLAGLPKQRTFVPSLWWALVLTPILAGVAFLLRAPVAAELAKLLDRLPSPPAQLPAPTTSQVALVVGVVVGLGLLVSAGAVYYCWEQYLRD